MLRVVDSRTAVDTLRDSPAYPRLVDTLLAIRPTEYSPLAAHVCAVASGWVYTKENAGAVVMRAMAQLGLDGVSYEEVALHNDLMFVASTAVLLQSPCGRLAILCYRGTEPQNLASWMADFDVRPRFVRMGVGAQGRPSLVHLGFFRNLRVTWHAVREALGRALEGRSVGGRANGHLRPLEALYITGHSLGAAIAALAGVYLAADPIESRHFRTKLRGIYTFGQPMIGDVDFAAACDEDPLLRRGVFRHVYGRDVVPHLPPLVYGRFAHFGRELRAPSGRGWREEPHRAEQAPDVIFSIFVVPRITYWAAQLAITRNLATLGYSWYDHLPQFYIEASEPMHRSSEGVPP